MATRTLAALRSIVRSRNRRIRREAAHYEFLHKTEAYRKFGFGNFGDFAREFLQTTRRSAKRRVDLQIALSISPELADALDEGRVSICQALALRPVLGRGEVARWLDLAAHSSVRELRAHVAAALERDVEEDASDSAWQRVAFSAPVSAAIAWDQGLECARRVLGETEAPAYFCVETLLAEAGIELEIANSPLICGATTERAEDSAVGAALRADAREFVDCSAADRARLSESIRLAALDTEVLKLNDDPKPVEPRASVRWLRDARHADRKLRLRFVQLLHNADRAGVLKVLGYSTITAFLMGELKLSERTAQRVMSAGWLFEDNPVLAHAYTTGRIGLGQAFMVDRVARSSTLEALIARAESTTHLEFEREVRFLERLAEFVPDVANAFPGPLPEPALEEVLRARLQGSGWTRGRIETAILSRMPKLTREAMKREPGNDRASFCRLEVLLEVLALTEEDEPVDETDPEAAPTLPIPRRWTTVSFWAPRDLTERWTQAIHAVRLRSGPLPTWAAAILIVEHAVNEWERIDPARRPQQTPIFERDEWRCQAPGCSARRRLEAHHIIFQSRGGSDDPDNLITLCHEHHRQGVHQRRLKVSGKAPWNLTWRMGSPGYRWTWPRPKVGDAILPVPV